jgi:hypothetical protein
MLAERWPERSSWRIRYGNAFSGVLVTAAYVERIAVSTSKWHTFQEKRRATISTALFLFVTIATPR